MAPIYQDGSYLDLNPTWHAEDSPWKARQIAQLIDHHDLHPKTICEIGCGAGEILNQLSRQYSDDVEFFGYEISPHAYTLCSARSTSNLTFRLADLTAEPDSFFDVLLVIDVLEHVDDYLGFLRKLRPRSDYKIFHIPLDISIQTVLRSAPILEGRTRAGHLHYFTKETALATLRDTGYDIIDQIYTGGSIELPDRGWKANLLKVPRQLAFAVNQDLAVRVLGGYSLLVLAR